MEQTDNASSQAQNAAKIVAALGAITLTGAAAVKAKRFVARKLPRRRKPKHLTQVNQ